MTINPDKINNAIDLNATAVVDELTENNNLDPSDVIPKFIQSRTGHLLFDESSKYWWDGPSQIADDYKKYS